MVGEGSGEDRFVQCLHLLGIQNGPLLPLDGSVSFSKDSGKHPAPHFHAKRLFSMPFSPQPLVSAHLARRLETGCSVPAQTWTDLI
jgi:hypothetical protein